MRTYFFRALSLILIASVTVLAAPANSVDAATAIVTSTTSLPSAGTSYYHVIDISHYNSVTWSALDSRLDAVYMKATEGTSYTDPTVAANVAGAQSRSLPYGFYHYLSMTSDPTAQAEYFYSVIKAYGYTCVPVLDVEFDARNNIYSNQTWEGLRAMVQTFITRFEQLSGGISVMIYCGLDMTKYLASNGTASVSDVQFLSQQRLWISAYKNTPAVAFPQGPQELWGTTNAGNATNTTPIYIWSTYDMWQYTDQMTISGVDGGVDGDLGTAGIFISTPETLSNVDTSTTGKTYSGFLTITGWELSRSGIARVDFYADDNQPLGSTSALTTRADVQSAMNKTGYYLDPSKCGYSYTFYASSLSNGTHTIHIAGISNNGTVKWDSITINVSGQAYTVLEAPANNTVSSNGNIQVSGWALNKSGISRVDISATSSDGTVYSLGSVSAQNLTQRSDVQMKHSDYTDALNSGYSLSVPAASLKSGSYTLTATGVGTDGGTKSTSVALTVASPKTTLDMSADQEIDGDSIAVKGWALNHSGISRIDVYAFDSSNNAYGLGSISGSALTSRSDITKQYAAYGTQNSGFSQSFSLTQLKQGTYTLAVAAIGNDGDTQWATTTFSYQAPPRMAVETPVNNAYVSKTFTVSGWALNQSGVSRVDLYAYDSTGKSYALGSVSSSAFTARADVAAAYPAYGTSTCGFSAKFSTSSLKSDTYTLAVAAIGKDGTVQWSTSVFRVGTAPSSQLSIDAPANGRSAASNLNVSGWALAGAGVQRIDIYAFDRQGKAYGLGSTSTSIARTDVQNAFPAFGVLNSGFNTDVSVASLPAGTYTLAVAAVDYNGSAVWQTRSITVGPAAVTTIDTPINGSTVSKQMTVSGWALNHGGSARVDIYAFDSSGKAYGLGSTSTFTARADVQKVFPAYQILNSGYSLTVSLDALPAGKYTLAAAGIGNDGDVTWQTYSITVTRS